MNSLTRNLIALRSAIKYRNIFTTIQKAFASKKNTKPSSGSDVEVDKSKKSVRSSGAVSEDNEPKSQSQPEVPKSSSPNVKVINSVVGHKPPVSEDTVSGRYAATLFIASSQAQELFSVYEDMVYLSSVYEKSESFRTFADNAGLNSKQINSFVEDLSSCGNFCKSTLVFLDLVGKNKRFMYVNEIAKKYIRAYSMLSKEEKIKIISAHELNSTQKERVKEALLANPENAGKSFVIDYEVNPDILGGLQMYSENRFMDLSLNSRVDRLKEEVNKMI